MELSIGQPIIASNKGVISLLIKDINGNICIVTSSTVVGENNFVYPLYGDKDGDKDIPIGTPIYRELSSTQDIVIIKVTTDVSSINTLNFTSITSLRDLQYQHYEVILHRDEQIHKYPVTFHSIYNSESLKDHIAVNISRELAYRLAEMETKVGILLVCLNSNGIYTPVGHYRFLDTFGGNLAIFTRYEINKYLWQDYTPVKIKTE